MDLTALLYLVVMTVSLIGFFIFSWWWYKNKKATKVYAYVTLMFLAEVIYQAGNLHARILMNIDEGAFIHMLESKIWSIRIIPLLFVQIFIICHVARRVIRNRRGIKMAVQMKDNVKVEENEILVVEDNLETNKVLLQALNIQYPRMKIHTAENVAEALALLTEHENISLIITDIKLRKRTGFQLCKEVKEERPWIIVIGITGYQDQIDVWTTRGMGFDDFFVKPFRIWDLLDSVKVQFEKLNRWKMIRDNTNHGHINEQNFTVGEKHDRRKEGENDKEEDKKE